MKKNRLLGLIDFHLLERSRNDVDRLERKVWTELYGSDLGNGQSNSLC